uniref:Uncharacterized protein n=1 Tax=Arundo donax TaxID=35708 RepID=A0A0A9EVL7_ARUDO
MAKGQWVISYCLKEDGFPKLLWETLFKQGYTKRLEYVAGEHRMHGTLTCEMELTVFDCVAHPEWAPWKLRTLGTSLKDTYQILALHHHCQEHEELVSDMVMRYFPVSDTSHNSWIDRMSSLEGAMSTEGPTAIAMARCLNTLDSMYRNLAFHYHFTAWRVEVAKHRERALCCQLGQAHTQENMTRRRAAETMRAWKESENEYIEEINKAFTKCREA